LIATYARAPVFFSSNQKLGGEKQRDASCCMKKGKSKKEGREKKREGLTDAKVATPRDTGH